MNELLLTNHFILIKNQVLTNFNIEKVKKSTKNKFPPQIFDQTALQINIFKEQMHFFVKIYKKTHQQQYFLQIFKLHNIYLIAFYEIKITLITPFFKNACALLHRIY